jgi:hypothetical protein
MYGPPRGGLFVVFANIADPRGRMGRRHNLPAMLAGMTCGILAGARSLTGITQWIHDQEVSFWHQLGFLRKPPCANCFRDLLLALPAATLESAISQWVTGLVESTENNLFLQAIAIDGKTLRGAMQEHGRSIHLLAALDHATGSVLKQLQMPPETNEHKTALELLKSMVLKGKVITGDAMFCQRDVCEEIVDSGGDYLFTVKDNQPDLKSAIAADFEPGFSPRHRGQTPAAA